MLVNLSARSAIFLDISPWIDPFRETSSLNHQSIIETGRDQLSGTLYIRTGTGINSMEIKYDGKIQVSDDDKSIRSISPNGYLKVGYRTFGNKCELLVYSNRTGHLSYEFYEGRKEIPFEPEGKEWLADVLLDVVRSTGIDAEGLTTRVNSIDYLLKPISYDDLFRSMNKLSSLRENLITGTQRLELEELAKVLDPEQFFRINRTFALHINGIKDVIIHSNSHLIRSLLSAGRR